MASANKELTSCVKGSGGLRVQQPFKSPLRLSDTNKEKLESSLRGSKLPHNNCENSVKKNLSSTKQDDIQEPQEIRDSRTTNTNDGSTPLSITPKKPFVDNNCRGRRLSHSRSSPGQFKAPFRSPVSSVSVAQQVISKEDDLNKLLRMESELDEEIASLKELGFKVEELQDHISNLHQYNEIKDAAQVVMGRLAELEGVTVKEIHEKYGASSLV